MGRRSSIHTRSPTEYVLASSCAWYFFERRMVFFIVGCAKRRSTRTIMVLSCLSLTTTPWSVRFGISNPLFLRLRLGARLRLRGGLRFSGLRLLFGLFSLRGRGGLCNRLRHSGAILCGVRLHACDDERDHTDAGCVYDVLGWKLGTQLA